MLEKVTDTTVLVSLGDFSFPAESPDVVFCVRVFSYFFGHFRNSFVSRENSVSFNSMSSFSFTAFIKCSVGFSFSSPCTMSVLCLSFLFSLSCLAFNHFISSAWIGMWFLWAATAPFKLVSSSRCCWKCCLVELISAFSASRSGFTVARTCLDISSRSIFVSSGLSCPGAWVAVVGMSAMLFVNNDAPVTVSAVGGVDS